jgi:hypothetical protein
MYSLGIVRAKSKPAARHKMALVFLGSRLVGIFMRPQGNVKPSRPAPEIDDMNIEIVRDGNGLSVVSEPPLKNHRPKRRPNYRPSGTWFGLWNGLHIEGATRHMSMPYEPALFWLPKCRAPSLIASIIPHDIQQCRPSGLLATAPVCTRRWCTHLRR